MDSLVWCRVLMERHPPHLADVQREKWLPASSGNWPLVIYSAGLKTLSMRSKNKPAMTATEREHVARVKSLPCSVCDAPGPSDAHHIEQSLQFCVVALCKECHQGPFMGWHGQKRAWAIRKMTEIDALNVTVGRLVREFC